MFQLESLVKGLSVSETFDSVCMGEYRVSVWVSTGCLYG